MKRTLFVILFLFVTMILFISCREKNPGNDYYWGHGFGMGYGSGCFETANGLSEYLGLTKDQETKIEAVDLKYRQLYFENRGNFDKVDSLRKSHKDEILGVLDEKQKEKYEKFYTAHWGGWGPNYKRRFMGDYYGHGYGMGFGSGCYATREYMKQDLNLSDDQVKKIEELDIKYRDLYQKNRGNYRAIDSIRTEHRGAIEKILTPEQRKKYSETYDYRWRGRGPGRHMGPGMMGY